MTGRRAMMLRVGGSIAVLGMLLLFLPFAELASAIRSVPLTVWPVAIAAYLTAHLAGVVKWRILTNVSGAGLSFAGALRAYYWGLFGTTFLPSVVGGDVVKVATALRGARSRSGLVLGTFMDRLLDIAGFLAISGFGALLSPRALDPRSRSVFMMSGLLIVLMSIVVIASLAVVRFTAIPFRFRRAAAKVRRSWRAASRRPAALVTAWLLGIGLQVALIIINYWIGLAMGIVIPLFVWLFVWPLAKIAALFPLTQGGIGVREAALALLFAPFGVSAAAAVASGLAFQAVVIGGGLLSGAIVTFGRPAIERNLKPGLGGAT